LAILATSPEKLIIRDHQEEAHPEVWEKEFRSIS
jgi:hypothetical protein